MITAITDHAARALGRLKAQFTGSDELRGLVTALALECQALDTAVIETSEVIRDSSLCAIYGKSSTLEKIASLVSARARGSLSDNAYSDLIYAQIQANKSDGSVDDLLAICAPLTPPTLGSIIFVIAPEDTPSPDALSGGVGVTLLIPELAGGMFDTAERVRNLMALLKQATPAGNRTLLVAAIEPTNDGSAGPFMLDGSNADGSDLMLCVFDSPDTVR